MFNEKSSVWIRIYKILVIVSTVLMAIGGLVWSIGAATHYGYYYGTYFEFGEFLIFVLIVAVLALFNLTGGMLIVNFLNNVQLIREKLESGTQTSDGADLPEL